MDVCSLELTTLTKLIINDWRIFKVGDNKKNCCIRFVLRTE